jgi:hypothetical protein
VNPAVPTLPEIQQRAVQLASTDWSQVLATAGDNLNALENEIAADPNPILTQLEANYAGYADTISTSLQNAFQGLEKVINGVPGDEDFPGLEATLQTVFNDLQQGRPFDAFTAFDPFELDAVKGVIKPLAPALGIPDEILQHYANLYHQFFGADVSDVLGGHDPAIYTFPKEILNALEAPFIGATFQETYNIQNGDAFDLASVVDAFLNGYTYPGHAEPFAGLLNEGGTLDYFLVTLPQEIATALASPTEPISTVAESADPAAAVDLATAALG